MQFRTARAMTAVMTTNSYLFLFLMLGVVALNTVAQLLFKAGIRTVNTSDLIGTLVFNLPIIAGYVLFFLGSLAYLYVIRHVPLSTAFPTTVLIHAFVLIAAHFIFGEAIGAAKLFGIALIFTGVYFIWL